jgi:hypothetical protein
MPRLAYCVYETRVVFTVDLDADAVLGVEIYRETLVHVDTGLSFLPEKRDWPALQARARALVERQPDATPVRWADDEPT